MPKRSALAVLLILLSACATRHEPGWQGNDAQPFGEAHAVCQNEHKAAAAFERDMVYRHCMARHGWTRPPEGVK